MSENKTSRPGLVMPDPPLSRDLPPLFAMIEARHAREIEALCATHLNAEVIVSRPCFTLDVACAGEFVRRIVVLAPSSEAALFKGREQLEDGETLSFCFANLTQR